MLKKESPPFCGTLHNQRRRRLGWHHAGLTQFGILNSYVRAIFFDRIHVRMFRLHALAFLRSLRNANHIDTNATFIYNSIDFNSFFLNEINMRYLARCTPARGLQSSLFFRMCPGASVFFLNPLLLFCAQLSDDACTGAYEL